MPFDRGNVILAVFPDSNLRTSQRRPVLVVQRDNLNSGLKQVVVAMITSNMARAGHPSRVEVRKGSQHGSAMGLLTDSVIATDKMLRRGRRGRRLPVGRA